MVESPIEYVLRAGMGYLNITVPSCTFLRCIVAHYEVGNKYTYLYEWFNQVRVRIPLKNRQLGAQSSGNAQGCKRTKQSSGHCVSVLNIEAI